MDGAKHPGLIAGFDTLYHIYLHFHFSSLSYVNTPGLEE